MSAQAAGGAVGRNPISIIIPCRRVVGANGSLTGSAGIVEKKMHLLTLEKRIWSACSSRKRERRGKTKALNGSFRAFCVPGYQKMYGGLPEKSAITPCGSSR